MPDPKDAVEAASAAIERGDFADALVLLVPLAEQGEVQAAALLGFVCWMEADIPEGIRWLTFAADKGRGDAAHNLGMLYSCSVPGTSLPDPEKCLHWFRRACELGFQESQGWLDYTGGTGMLVPHQ